MSQKIFSVCIQLNMVHIHTHGQLKLFMSCPPSACILTCLEILLITKTVKSIFGLETQKSHLQQPDGKCGCCAVQTVVVKSVAVVQCRLLSKVWLLLSKLWLLYNADCCCQKCGCCAVQTLVVKSVAVVQCRILLSKNYFTEGMGCVGRHKHDAKSTLLA